MTSHGPKPPERSDDEFAAVQLWVRTWEKAGPRLDVIHRAELRRLDPFKAITALCRPVDYTVPPRKPRPTSGLVEQQRWFMKAAGHRD